mgnify:CR=1 FL=1
MLALKKLIGEWVADHTEVVVTDDGEYEVATTEVDAYGDTIYVWVKPDGAGYRVGDDGRLLFKLDPGAEDAELMTTAEEIALGSGYEYNHETGEIFVMVTEKQLAGAIMRLALLQTAISYVG